MTTQIVNGRGSGRTRLRFGLVTTIIGFVVFLIGAVPDLFGLDRSPVVGFVQVSVFLLGIGFICLGGAISLAVLWIGIPKSIASDIGLRLVGTGYVITMGSGMADIFGFGSQSFPKIPFFGTWQLAGVLLGELVIGIGLLMMIPWQRLK